MRLIEHCVSVTLKFEHFFCQNNIANVLKCTAMKSQLLTQKK